MKKRLNWKDWRSQGHVCQQTSLFNVHSPLFIVTKYTPGHHRRGAAKSHPSVWPVFCHTDWWSIQRFSTWCLSSYTSCSKPEFKNRPWNFFYKSPHWLQFRLQGNLSLFHKPLQQNHMSKAETEKPLMASHHHVDQLPGWCIVLCFRDASFSFKKAMPTSPWSK